MRENFGKTRCVFGNCEISKIPETRQAVDGVFSADIDELNAVVKAVGQTDLEITSRHGFRISQYGLRHECGWLLISKAPLTASRCMAFISSENSGI